MDSEQLRLIRRMAKIEAEMAQKAAGGDLVSRMQLAAGGSASLSSAGHPLQVGETSGSNIIMDSRNIMARENGSAAALYLNKNGGNVMMPRLRLTAKDDASLTSNGHALQVGDTAGTNLIIDNNEIIARNNREASTLYLNPMGGGVTTPTVRLSATAGANLISSDHALQIGPSDDRNLRASQYGIMSVSNGAAAALQLNQYGGNVHVGYDASDGELLVHRNTVLHKGNVNSTLLTYPVGWNSGLLGIPGSANYTAFLIITDGQGTVIPVFKQGQHIRGVGGFVTATPTFRELFFTATYEGEEWTLVACKYIDHTVSGGHSIATNLTIVGVRGML